MISIRKYLEANNQTQEALVRLVRLLIEGLERHSVTGTPEEVGLLRESTQQALAALDSAAPPDELVACGERAVEALERYNRHVVEYCQRPGEELRAKVKLLTSAITAVSCTSQANIRRLQEIKGQVLASVDVKDIRSLRVHLSECLDGVLSEAQRQRSEADRATEQLNRRSCPPPVPGSPAETRDEDPATGLPTRAQAEEAIAQACQDEAPAFVVVMALNRMQPQPGGFSDPFAEVALQHFAAFVRQQFPSMDQLFRWSGLTLIALIRRSSSLDTVRISVGALLTRKLEYTVRSAARDVRLPISARWTVLPLMASPRLLFHKMDGFAGTG